MKAAEERQIGFLLEQARQIGRVGVGQSRRLFRQRRQSFLGQRLDNAETESGATNAAAGAAQSRAAQFAELAIERLAVGDPIPLFVLAAASVGVLVVPVAFVLLAGGEPFQFIDDRLGLGIGQVVNGLGFGGQHLLDR